MTERELRARMERLNKLARGLAHEHERWRRGDGTPADKEGKDYMNHIRDAYCALDHAAGALAALFGNSSACRRWRARKGTVV